MLKPVLFVLLSILTGLSVLFLIGVVAHELTTPENDRVEEVAPAISSALPPLEEPIAPQFDITPSDSVFVWEDSLYTFIAHRLWTPEDNKPPGKNNAAKDSISITQIDWPILTDIEYRSEYFEEMEMELYSPIFPDRLKKLDGRLVEITGYVIPVVEDGSEVALSANPYAACFFCGKASPASVMSIMFTKPQRRLRTDDYKTIIGRMRLNYDDPNQFYYILEQAYLKRP